MESLGLLGGSGVAAGKGREELAKKLLAAVHELELHYGAPLIVAVLDPANPRVAELLPEPAAAYAACPPVARVSSMMVVTHGGWSTYTVDPDGHGIFCHESAERWRDNEADERPSMVFGIASQRGAA